MPNSSVNRWTVAEVKGDWVRLEKTVDVGQGPFPQKGAEIAVLDGPAPDSCEGK